MSAEALRGELDLGFAKLDLAREHRSGQPEVVYAEGKSSEELLEIAAALERRKGRLLVTRLDREAAEPLLGALPGARYHQRARVLALGSLPRQAGTVAVLAAGTSDLAVAEEAAVCLDWLGHPARTHYDVGVAGLHRLLGRVDSLREADAVVAVAGMDGALPSVVAGLVPAPVVAVPTSIGFGASFAGLAALLTMLNSCAPGVTVVNIDGGFSAAAAASRILRARGGG